MAAGLSQVSHLLLLLLLLLIFVLLISSGCYCDGTGGTDNLDLHAAENAQELSGEEAPAILPLAGTGRRLLLHSQVANPNRLIPSGPADPGQDLGRSCRKEYAFPAPPMPLKEPSRAVPSGPEDPYMYGRLKDMLACRRAARPHDELDQQNDRREKKAAFP